VTKEMEAAMWEPTVESVMTTQVVTARPDTPCKERGGLMSEHRVSGLPVVDSEGKPAGVVSEADTLAKQDYQGGTVPRPLFVGRKRRARWHKAVGLTAAELMTAPAVVIRENETVSAAARLLAKKNVRRLCVVDAAGVLVGLVSRHDVIGTFLRDDDAIRADVEEHVFKRGMWLFPEPLTAEVTGGVVTLDGAVERRTTAQIAGQLTHAVPGVVGVHNKVRYELDDSVTTAL
jgi:CBS-domain-containing membrane protein